MMAGVAMLTSSTAIASASALVLTVAFSSLAQGTTGVQEDQVDKWLKELEQLFENKDWKAAEELARKAVVATKDEVSIRRGRVLDLLGDTLLELNRYPEALPLYHESLQMRRRLFEGVHPDVAASLKNVAFCLYFLGRTSEALPLFQESLQMYRQLFNGDHPDTADSLDSVATCLFSLDHALEALPLYQESLQMRRRMFKGDHPDVATSLSSVAICLDKLGRTSEALRPYQDSLLMRRRLFKGDHPDVAESLKTVGTCLWNLGRYSEALALSRENLDMIRRLYEGDHPAVAGSLNNVATCLLSLGRFLEALPVLQESLEMRRHIFEGDDEDVAESLNNAASCLHELGRTQEALPLFQESLQMHRRLYKGDHPALATNLNNVASCLETLGRSTEALPLHEETLQMRRRLFKGDHPAVAGSLKNLATCLDNLGRSSEALPLHEETLQMRRRLFKGDHPDVASSLNSVAGSLDSLGRTFEALRLYWESLQMRRQLFEEGHPNVSESLDNVVYCLDKLKRSPEALPLRRQWLAGLSTFVRRSTLVWEAGADKRPERFAEQLAAVPQTVLSSEYSLVSQARFFLRQAASLSRAVSSLPEDKALRELRYAMLETKVGAEQAALGQGDVGDARLKADAAFARYSQALEAMHGDRLRLKAPSLGELEKALGKDALAVDIYRRTDRKEPYYLAVVLGAGAPKFVELATEAQLKAPLNALNASLANKGVGAEFPLATLDKLTLGKLDRYLKGKSKLYLAVDGVLAQVPFAALVSGTTSDPRKPGGQRNRFRVEDFQIGIVPSVLDIAAKSFGAGGTGAVLVGDVDYEAVTPRTTAEGVKHIRLVQPPSGTRGSLPTDGKWKPLPGSTKEMQALTKLPAFRQATVFRRAGATEPALLEKIRSPRYLHFSTHGFFIAKKEDLSSSKRLGEIAASDDSMYRSVLVLSGANAKEPGPVTNDGYLMASEASRLNLSGTRLVTLAACESGLGDNSVGQGVLGLRRAFRAAGAQGVVMSLYSVPDAETADLMAAFYGSLGKGKSAPAALRQAQLELLRKGQGVSRWGLFVYEGFEK